MNTILIFASLFLVVCGSPIHALEKATTDITFVNYTDTQVKVELVFFTKNPVCQHVLTTLVLQPGQTEQLYQAFDVEILLKNNFAVKTQGGDGYGCTWGSLGFGLLALQGVRVELVEKWVYPGDDLWPPVDSFRVAKVKIIR